MTKNVETILPPLTKASLLAILSAASPAWAETNLVLSSWLPPRHPIVVNAIEPWADQVEAATQGRVTIRVLRRPLGSPVAHYDMARNGVADITYGVHSFTADDRFMNARIGEFSFLGEDAIAASKAFWTVYTEDLGATAEHHGTKVLGLFVHGPGLFVTKHRRIESLADFEGLKIRVPGGYSADLAEALGTTTLFMPSTEVFETLSRGVIDGVTFPYEALTAFNLIDDVDHIMTVPGGLYNTTWFLVMNEQKWAQISPDDQAAIEAMSGLAFATLVGQAWNDADAAALADITAAGVAISPAPDAVLAAITERATTLEMAWAEGLNAAYDGMAALTRLRDLSADHP